METMTTISVQATRTISGPISQDGNAVLNQLIKHGETEMALLRERASLIRSRFWKTVFDLKDLGLVVMNHNH